MSRNSTPFSRFTGFLYDLLFTNKMANIRLIINRCLTITIVLVFILTGTMKLSARLSYVTHVHMQREFHRYAPVCPTRIFGHTPDPHNYRTLVGVTEIACAVLLLIGNRFIRRMANHVLVLLMLGAFFTHCILGDPVASVIPSMVMVFLISWRHYTTGVFITMDDDVKED